MSAENSGISRRNCASASAKIASNARVSIKSGAWSFERSTAVKEAIADELEGLCQCCFRSQSQEEAPHVNSIATNTRAFGPQCFKVSRLALAFMYRTCTHIAKPTRCKAVIASWPKTSYRLLAPVAPKPEIKENKTTLLVRLQQNSS